MEMVTQELLAEWIDRQLSKFQARAGIWGRRGWLSASPRQDQARLKFPFPSSESRDLPDTQLSPGKKVTQAARRAKMNQEGRDCTWGPHPGAEASPSRKSVS